MAGKVVGVIGASGYIGVRLCSQLEEGGWKVVRISRSERKVPGEEWRVFGEDCVAGLDALVNLAGDRIDKRWTEKNKRGFWESRVGVTRTIRKWLGKLVKEERPQVWVNVSAVGIYGDRGDEVLLESSDAGEGFLADLCVAWEAATRGEGSEGVRLVHPRIGVVLGEGSPAWERMYGLFKLGLGGRLGSGQQWFPWVDVDDVVKALLFCVEDDEMQEAVNVCAPRICRNVEFTAQIAEAVGMWAVLPAPRWGLRLALGEFADALLASQRVEVGKLAKRQFVFECPSVVWSLRRRC